MFRSCLPQTWTLAWCVAWIFSENLYAKPSHPILPTGTSLSLYLGQHAWAPHLSLHTWAPWSALTPEPCTLALSTGGFRLWEPLSGSSWGPGAWRVRAVGGDGRELREAGVEMNRGLLAPLLHGQECSQTVLTSHPNPPQLKDPLSPALPTSRTNSRFWSNWGITMATRPGHHGGRAL